MGESGSDFGDCVLGTVQQDYYNATCFINQGICVQDPKREYFYCECLEGFYHDSLWLRNSRCELKAQSYFVPLYGTVALCAISNLFVLGRFKMDIFRPSKENVIKRSSAFGLIAVNSLLGYCAIKIILPKEESDTFAATTLLLFATIYFTFKAISLILLALINSLGILSSLGELKKTLAKVMTSMLVVEFVAVVILLIVFYSGQHLPPSVQLNKNLMNVLVPFNTIMLGYAVIIGFVLLRKVTSEFSAKIRGLQDDASQRTKTTNDADERVAKIAKRVQRVKWTIYALLFIFMAAATRTFVAWLMVGFSPKSGTTLLLVLNISNVICIYASLLSKAKQKRLGRSMRRSSTSKFSTSTSD